MALTENTINLTKRETPGAMLRRVTPTTARVQLTVYDRKNRVYKAVPGFLALFPIKSRSELLALWRQLRDALEGGTWKDADCGDGGGSSGPDVAPGDGRNGTGRQTLTTRV
jgi:hypothetical protein